MSWFGDGTPAQRILEEAEILRDDGVTAIELIEALSKVINYYAEQIKELSP